MDQFDGQQWRQSDKTQLAVNRAPMEDSIFYAITVQPSYNKWLFALAAPQSLVAGAGQLQDNSLLANNKIEQVWRYQLRSSEQLLTGQAITNSYQQQLLQLPKTLNPLSLQLSQQLWAQSSNQLDYIQRLLNYFNQQPFFYSLNPPLLTSEHQIDEFLFTSQKGFCSHYASAMVVLARMQGIPSRIVAGYQGAEYNSNGDFWQIRQQQAHAWVEVYINQTWHRIDPTMAVAPERMNRALKRLPTFSQAP